MNCSELKMNPFIKCLLTGNTESVGGVEVWEEIYNEFISLRENKDATYIMTLMAEIEYLKVKEKIISVWCVPVLALTYNRDFVNELKQVGCKGKFDWSDPVGYSNDLRAAVSYAKKYKGQYERKEKELEDYYKKHKGGEMTQKFFEDLAATLEKYYNHYIDFDAVTVSRFVAKWNQYDKYCEVTNAEANNLMNKKHG